MELLLASCKINSHRSDPKSNPEIADPGVSMEILASSHIVYGFADYLLSSNKDGNRILVWIMVLYILVYILEIQQEDLMVVMVMML